MSFASFLVEYKWILLFYAVIFSLIYINRKKFEIKGIVALYRTNFGINLIERVTSKNRELIKLIGYIGIGAGYVGLIFISVVLIKNLYTLFTSPEAQAGVAIILPGVHVPGSPIFLPFWFGIISLFVFVFVHEFGHAIVARAHGLKIKSSGFGMMAIIPIAFVEPDEKSLRKQKDIVQYSIFAAGPFFNILTAMLAFLLLFFVLTPIHDGLTEPVGFSISDVQKDFPAEKAGLTGGMVITNINNFSTLDYDSFTESMHYVRPGDTIIMKANNTIFEITTTTNPGDENMPYIGILGLTSERELKSQSKTLKFFFSILSWFISLFQWIGLLNLGIGLANLLPLGPVDGGRMLQVSLSKIVKDKKRGNKIWVNISIICLLVLLLNIFLPMFRTIFF